MNIRSLFCAAAQQCMVVQYAAHAIYQAAAQVIEGLLVRLPCATFDAHAMQSLWHKRLATSIIWFMCSSASQVNAPHSRRPMSIRGSSHNSRSMRRGGKLGGAYTGTPRRLGERAERELGLWREQPQRALKAGRDARQDDARMPLEALCAGVHHRLYGRQIWRPLVVVFCMRNC